MFYIGMYRISKFIICFHYAESFDYCHLSLWIYAWQKEGMMVGFISGLLFDIMFSDLIGFYTLIYTVLGYANGFFRKIFYPDDIKLPLILITASDFLYGNVVCLFMFIMRSRFNYFYYLKSIIIPELIYTVLVTLILYTFILHINKKLEAKEQRSASKFV